MKSRAARLVRDEVLALAPYNAGLTVADVVDRYSPANTAKLGSNENPLGPSPAAVRVAQEGCGAIRLYPDPQGRVVRNALGKKHGARVGRIILGNGSEDLLSVIARGVLRPRDTVLTLYPSFPLHEDYAILMGANVKRVSLDGEFRIDVEELIAELATGPRVFLFSNPMNPVGVMLSLAELKRIFAAVKPETLIVVDEAYGEYVAREGFASALEVLDTSRHSWIVLKTFSKAYGLAGLRLGYGISSDEEIVSLLDRVRTPFNCNSIAQAAAVAALSDLDHLSKVTELARCECIRISAYLSDLGCRPAPTLANFVFFDCSRNAVEVAESLLKDGVITKPWKQAGYESFLRVSAGTPSENDLFMSSIAKIFRSGKQ